MGDHFRNVENSYRQNQVPGCEWNCFSDSACITHLDDMTKVDLPHFSISASSDITLFRFDVDAHVSSFTGITVIFSHEQSTGAKSRPTLSRKSS